MIPYEIALSGWIVVAAALMYDRDEARGFSLAFMLGVLILPSGIGLNLPGAPELNKFNAPFIGILIGTLLFHPRTYEKFKLSSTDIFFLGLLQSILCTSIILQLGLRDGVVRCMTIFINIILPVWLARLHLGTPRAMRTFMLTIVGSACVYLPFCMYEFRFSPQLHRYMYGLFQHDFVQFYRNGYYRPLVCFTHALKLGQFFAFAAFLAAFPLRKDIVRLIGPWGRYIFLMPLLGLFLSMSYGPYLLFFLLAFMYWAINKQPWVAYIGPIIAFTWVITLFMGIQLGFDSMADMENVNAERAASLEYRVNAMTRYKENIMQHPFLGWGGGGAGRIDNLATDSQALIRLLEFGWVGTSFIYFWWLSAMYVVLRVAAMTPYTALEKKSLGLASMISLCIGISIIDNALDTYLLCLLGGYVGIHHWLVTRRDSGLAMPQPEYTQESGGHPENRPIQQGS